jgi:hypothetical protein
VPLAVGTGPACRPDDLVVADLCEFRVKVARVPAALLDQGLEDLTGLVGAVSGGRVFPPQMPVRDTAPLRVLCKQRRERVRVTAAECFGCPTKLVNHLSPPFPGRTAGPSLSSLIERIQISKLDARGLRL